MKHPRLRILTTLKQLLSRNHFGIYWALRNAYIEKLLEE